LRTLGGHNLDWAGALILPADYLLYFIDYLARPKRFELLTPRFVV